MSPKAFAHACHVIVTEQQGHAAHRALDLLTNDLLRALGYGDGIDIFEAAVAHWHDAAAPYPGAATCPDCARADSLQPEGASA
jgi:hypothetical protein